MWRRTFGAISGRPYRPRGVQRDPSLGQRVECLRESVDVLLFHGVAHPRGVGAHGGDHGRVHGHATLDQERPPLQSKAQCIKRRGFRV